MKDYYIYILSNKHNNVLYIGFTSDLIKRIWEHKNKVIKGFSYKYNIDKLVYYEIGQNPESAIEREKFLKHKTKQFKIDLITSFNPNFDDLYPKIIQ